MEFMYTLGELLKEYISFLSDVVMWLICICIGFIFLFALCVILVRRQIRKKSAITLTHLRKTATGEKTCVIGFFHPYCNAGGGGERVLWVAIQSLQKKYSNIRCVVYTGDIDATEQSILNKARDRFNISLTQPVKFIFLKKRTWVEAYRYPFLTLLGQSFGSILLGWEALMAFVPDIYVDSMGYAFTIPLFRYFGGCKVGCYVHYPTISTDMLEQVSQRNESYNNKSFVSRSPVLSYIKLQYYRLFAYLYGIAGKKCHFIMVNSTWTYRHIKQLWKAVDKTHIVYPPCNIKEFMEIPLKEDSKEKNIISIAQFRPEKNHALQIKSFHKFLMDINGRERNIYKLLLVGSCRNTDDQNRVKDLEILCKELDMCDNVDFKLNVSFQELKNLMSNSLIGLHTMWNEHFGIGIVELMAAGTIVVAHNSGGPKLDIVVPLNDHKTGFLADDEDSYAAVLSHVVTMSSQELFDIRRNARESVNRFSDSEFEHGFLNVIGPFITVES